MNHKPKINKAANFSTFDNIMNEPKSSVQLGMEAFMGKAGERATKGAAAGCKPGFSRKTFVLSFEIINKIKAISVHLDQSEVSIVLDMIEKGIASYEQQYGEEISKLWRVK